MMAMNSTGKEFFAVKKQKVPDAVNQNEPCYGLRLIVKAQEMADYL